MLSKNPQAIPRRCFKVCLSTSGLLQQKAWEVPIAEGHDYFWTSEKPQDLRIRTGHKEEDQSIHVGRGFPFASVFQK
jgi:hypothetical protein